MCVKCLDDPEWDMTYHCLRESPQKYWARQHSNYGPLDQQSDSLPIVLRGPTFFAMGYNVLSQKVISWDRYFCPLSHLYHDHLSLGGPINHEDEVEDEKEYKDLDLEGMEEHKSIILHLLSQLGIDLTNILWHSIFRWSYQSWRRGRR